MESYLTPSNITFVLGLVAILFSVYNSFRKPQIESDKTESLLSQSIARLQLDLTNLRDNHIHTLDQKIEEQNKNINGLSLIVTRLSTIIDERIPAKK